MRDDLPDASSTLKALQYVQGQAARGRFDGHASALSVLYCLVMNMWVRPSASQGQCEVMAGRASIDVIAGCTALSRRSVTRALAWLADEEWINTQRQLNDAGSEVHRYIYVRLDALGHRERERRREVTAEAERIVREAVGEGVTES